MNSAHRIRPQTWSLCIRQASAVSSSDGVFLAVVGFVWVCVYGRLLVPRYRVRSYIHRLQMTLIHCDSYMVRRERKRNKEFKRKRYWKGDIKKDFKRKRNWKGGLKKDYQRYQRVNKDILNLIKYWEKWVDSIILINLSLSDNIPQPTTTRIVKSTKS